MSRKQRALAAFEEVEPDLQAMSRWLYENPELAFEEFESSARLAAFLDENGLDVIYPAYGIPTSFEANVGEEGPRVVICAEYDALPQVGHACGHNIIATSSAGAGVALAGIADELGMRVTVLGTPAEEGGGGKLDLITAGAFEDCAASMMIHPSPRDIVDPNLVAAQGFTVTFRGRAAHASSSPHVGINALDAFVQAYNNISTLRQQFETSDRVHGVVIEGGSAPNVIPDLTVSKWIVRAATAERFEALRSRVYACFEAAATASGCSVDIEIEGEPYMDLVSHPLLAGLFSANAVALGRAMQTYAESGVETAASSDMGNVSHIVPTIHPSLAIDTKAVNHQPEFADATVTESGHRVLRDGAIALAYTVIDMAEHDVWSDL